jgi:uncharacterized protein (TIGR02145 family)
MKKHLLLIALLTGIATQSVKSNSYVIDLSRMTFNNSFIYEIWDERNNIKIGELCKEFLHKHMPGDAQPIVRKQTIVVYPMSSGRVDLTNGLVLENGHFVAWNTRVTSSTEPHNMLMSYLPGESITAMPTQIFLDAGASRMTTKGNPTGRIQAVLRPKVLVDQRQGARNNVGQITENFTYRIVKIGTQYWLADNLRTSRYSNGEPIPTNIGGARSTRGPGQGTWANAMTPGVSLAYRTPGPDGRAEGWVNANDRAAAPTAARNKVGLLYNFHAVIGAPATTGRRIPREEIVDRISPKGWSIPRRSEFQQMLNYVLQTSAIQTVEGEGEAEEATRAGVASMFSVYGTNETGFSAAGNNTRNTAENSWGGGTMYHTIDSYRYNADGTGTAQHRTRVFIIRTHRENGNVAFTSRDTHASHYIRLIRD